MHNIVYEKAFAFAIEIVRIFKYLQEEKEYIMSKQLLRSGTSIGANIKEAQQAQSHRDFLHKMNIALKEASETEYWLALLKATNYINEDGFNNVQSSCDEIKRLLVSIVKTCKNKK